MTRGRKIEEDFANRGLIVLNKANELPTCTGYISENESYIDITLTTPGLAARLVKNWRVVDSLIYRYHRAIEITLRRNVTELKQPNRKPRFKRK